MENFLKQDMLKTFLLLLRSVSVFIFVLLLIPITDKKKCAKFNKYIMHATCNRLFSIFNFTSPKGLWVSWDCPVTLPFDDYKIESIEHLKKIRYWMLVDNGINIMFVRGLWIGFLCMISNNHIYPGPEKTSKSQLI